MYSLLKKIRLPRTSGKRLPGLVLTLAFCLLTSSAGLSAQEASGPEAVKEVSSKPVPEPRVFEKHFQLQTAGEIIKYTTRAGELYLRDAKGEPTASIFSIAYLKDNVSDLSRRPLVFAFNGGPGSSAVWLHYGALGPMRVAVPANADPIGAAPYKIEPNPHSLLQVADLVLIDPVGTGYSQAIEPSKNEDFWGLDEDGRSIAEFIRLFISKNKRWNSPKYIIGESYGGTRVGKLLDELQNESNGINLNGIVLLSPALDFQTFLDSPGNVVYHVCHLPTYAAAAWYHNRLADKPADFQAFIREVDHFAKNEYLCALYRGDTLTADESEPLLNKLARYTGLSKEYWRRSNLRVDASRFAKELLRDRGLILGLYDSRYIGADYDLLETYPSWNPTNIDAGYVSAINDYLQRIMGIDLDRKYETMNDKVGIQWKRPAEQNGVFSGYVNVVPMLSIGVMKNRDLRILVASGYHDMVTPPGGADYAMSQSRIPADRFKMTCYEGGHMMYLHEPSLKKLANDLKEFISAGNKK